jgi:hypothetical protein
MNDLLHLGDSLANQPTETFYIRVIRYPISSFSLAYLNLSADNDGMARASCLYVAVAASVCPNKTTMSVQVEDVKFSISHIAILCKKILINVPIGQTPTHLL